MSEVQNVSSIPDVAKRMGHILREAVEKAYELGLEDSGDEAVARYRKALQQIAMIAADGHLPHPGYGGLPGDWQPKLRVNPVLSWVEARADLALDERKVEMLRGLK